MTEEIDPIRLLDNSPARRLWLLQEAMRSLPFDRAIELARIAETFITGAAAGATTHEPVLRAMTASEDPEQPKELVDQAQTNAAVLSNRPTEYDRLRLSNGDRDRLLERLAEGACNAKLAGEFGISAKQVQGLRMGSVREIARRRATLADKSSDRSREHDQQPTATASIDEIIRYLRQQSSFSKKAAATWSTGASACRRPN